MLNSLLCHCPRVFHTAIIKRYVSNNHYDVLKLSRNCTTKDIRHSFLKLSKQYHPDRSNNKNSHAKYVQILEAYKVLSKPQSRHLYDLGLSNPDYLNNVNVRHAPTGAGAYTEGFWESRDRSEDKFYEAKPYYGIKGMNKISNFTIVLICLTIATIGVALQILAIRHSFTMQREKMTQKSAELVELHSQIRFRALQNGDEKQLQILKQMLKSDD